MPYIFSTLTGGQEYTGYASGGGDIPVAERKVFVAGGSNLPDKRLITPIGVMTEVSDEDFSWLQENEVFKMHRANGFITVRDKEAAPEKVATEMETRDQSAPLVEADFEEGEAPVTNKPEETAPSPAIPRGRRRG